MGDYFQNILEQPQALRDTVAGLGDFSLLPELVDAIGSNEIQAIVLTGMGASYHALQPLTFELVAHGFNAQRIETSELIYHAPRLLNARNLVVAVSQSGQSAEILKLLAQGRAAGVRLIGITNTLDSPLAAACDAALLTRAGTEFSVSSKTYIASLAALLLLGAALTRQDLAACRAQLDTAADAMELYLTHWREYIAALEPELQGIEQMILVGRGASLAAVGAGALILQEAAHFPAQGMSSAAVRHGPLEMLSPHFFVLVLQGAAPTMEHNARLAADIRALGARAALVAQGSALDVFSLPPVPTSTLPLLEILVPQMLSLALARRRGHIPGKFEKISKVTTVE